MKTVIEMARESADPDKVDPFRNGFWVLTQEELEKFSELVRADERAECAKVCEEQSKELGGVAEGPFVTDFGKHTHMSMAAGAENCAAAIRARDDTK